MREENVKDLVDRVRRLERWNMSLGAGLVACAGLVLVGAGGSNMEPEADLIRARAIEIVDAQGRVRTRLGHDEDNSHGLFLVDDQGRTRAALIHDDSQTALFLLDEAGSPRVGTAHFAHGGSGYALHGAEGKGATVLYMKDGLGSLTFYGEDGAVARRIESAIPDAKAP